MSAAVEEVKFNLKAMINKERTKVLLAEMNSDFADILLSFVTMPLGKIVRLFETHYGDEAPIIGSLNSLRKGLVNLDSVHFWTEGCKHMLLNPISSFEDECCKLKLNVYDAQPTKYFTCGDWDCKKKGSHFVTMYHGTTECVGCGKSLNREISRRKLNTGVSNCGVFTINTESFLINNDLQMMPNVPGSIIQSLRNLGITDTDGAELRTVTVGFNQIMDLLKWFLLSKTPLTDLILNERRGMDSTTVKPLTVHQMDGKEATNSNSEKKMIVKAMVQKSTNKLIFIQAEEDFVDFLFSFLTIPLGGVVRLLGSKTSLGSVDNFCSSIANLKCDKHLWSSGIKDGLLNPLLPPLYCSAKQVFSLDQQRIPELYYYRNYEKWTEYVSLLSQTYTPCKQKKGSPMCFGDPKGTGGTYVKRPGTFVVNDDLTILPASCMTSSLSIVNRMKIPFSDVEELELQIGMEEGLSILKASLTSTFAITNGLGSMLKKQPKQEY